MKLLRELRHRMGSLLLPLFVGFVIVYAYYHMLTGQYGLMTWYDLSAQIAVLKQQNEQLSDVFTKNEGRIDRLRPETLDVDFLDEQIRRHTPYVRAEEYVLFRETNAQ